MEASSHLVKIPELLSLIGQHLTKHDFTVCIRVNKAWFNAFSPLLYHTISVVDFEPNLPRFKDPPTTAGATSTITSTSEEKILKGPEHGSNLIHRYCHLIRSITVANIHALTYLGDEAVNLAHIGVHVNLGVTTLFQPLHEDAAECLRRSAFWNYFRNGNVIIPIWVALIHRNPDLKSICVDLNYCDQGTEKIARALGEKANQLEDVVLWGMTQTDTIELFLDHCPHILSLTASCGLRGLTSLDGPDQIFRKEDDFGTPTKIRHLNIRCTESWLIHVLRRCPDLEDLTIPVLGTAYVFVAIVKEVTQLSLSKFFTLRSLTFTIRARDVTVPFFSIDDMKTPITNLLNSCCAQLVSLTVTDEVRILGQTMDQLDSRLWSRLEEFRYTSTSSTPHRFTAPTYRLCSLLALCPKLRVFEVSNTMVPAPEFLETRPACLQSLTSLKLTVCTDYSQIQPFQLQLQQPPPWITAFTAEQAQMATMAQFELPLQLPLTPVFSAGSSSTTESFQKRVSNQAADVYGRILEFSKLRTLEFGSTIPSFDICHITFPSVQSEDECVRVLKGGLPQLSSLQ
ncbi:hypothetical protein BGW39_003122, partial [Mortierella sp. 14UC]